MGRWQACPNERMPMLSIAPWPGASHPERPKKQVGDISAGKCLNRGNQAELHPSAWSACDHGMAPFSICLSRGGIRLCGDDPWTFGSDARQCRGCSICVCFRQQARPVLLARRKKNGKNDASEDQDAADE